MQFQQQFNQQQIQLYTAALAFHLQNQSGARNNQFQDLLSRLPLLQSQFLTNASGVSSSTNESLELKQRQMILIEANEAQLKTNQKLVDELRSKLGLLTSSNLADTDDQMKLVVDQLRKQLIELNKKQSDLLCEQTRLKNELESTLAPVSSFNFTNEYDDDDNKSSISSSSKTSSHYEAKLNENDNKRLVTGNLNDNDDQDESVEINEEENLNQKF